MEKLKLCHVALATYPDRKDGASKFLRGLYDEMIRRGHDVTLLTAKWGEGFQDPHVHAIEIPKLRFLWVPKFTWEYKSFLQKNNFDIIHSNGSRASLPILMANKPYIATIHDVGPFQTNFSRLPFVKWVERKNALTAKRIITCAESNRAEIQKYMGADIDKIFNVNSAIDPKFRPEPQKAKALREKLNLHGPIIYYVGRIEFYKGIADILAAYKTAKKDIPDLNLVVGGGATLTMQETVEAWKREYPDVKFVGIVPDEEMSTYYSMADVFCTYSYASEGFGLTPVEALGCGTPVIASTMPAFKEVLQKYAYFVEPKQPQLLAQQFIQFFKNIDQGKQLVKDAQAFIQRYTWKNVGDLVENVYRGYLQEFSKK